MSETLEHLFTSYWRFLAVRAACKLDLFEHLASGCDTITQLAVALNADPSAIGSLIGALAHEGLVCLNDGIISMPEATHRLCADHPQSLKHACLMWGGEHMVAWQNLDRSIRYGRAVFPELFGKPFFKFLDDHRERASEYHKAMYSYARSDFAAIGNDLDLAPFSSVLDVGGGNGALVDSLRRVHPSVAFRIFDIQDHRSEETRDIAFIHGDFFETIPKGSDGLILSRVIHDWADEDALQILRNCHAALPQGGLLFLIENDLSLLGDGGHLLTLNMLAVCGSRERSVEEYQLLLERSAFEVQGLRHHGKHAIIKAIRS